MTIVAHVDQLDADREFLTTPSTLQTGKSPDTAPCLSASAFTVADGAIVPGKRMNITLSADHRVTDGAEEARYLQAVKRYLENPLTIAFA